MDGGKRAFYALGASSPICVCGCVHVLGSWHMVVCEVGAQAYTLRQKQEIMQRFLIYCVFMPSLASLSWGPDILSTWFAGYYIYLCFKVSIKNRLKCHWTLNIELFFFHSPFSEIVVCLHYTENHRFYLYGLALLQRDNYYMEETDNSLIISV